MAKVSVNLSPNQVSLQGLYSPGDDVLVICDATNGDFTIPMPDAYSCDDTLFRFVKDDASTNIITLSARPGQQIMHEDTQALTDQDDELVLNSDGSNWH